MSRGPENTFIGSVHRHLPDEGVYHMKNHNEYVGGVADVWYSGKRADLWVEYKFIKVPARDTTVIDLVSGKQPEISYLQQDWLANRLAEGRVVLVIVGSEKGGVIFAGTSWQKPISAAEFRSNLLTRKEIAAWIASTAKGP